MQRLEGKTEQKVPGNWLEDRTLWAEALGASEQAQKIRLERSAELDRIRQAYSGYDKAFIPRARF